MDDSLRLLARARDQLAHAEQLLAAADDVAWAGPSAQSYRERLDERRTACVTLLAEVDAAYGRALAALRTAA
ncbi:hypothetical protein [Demequina lignilytica]|uniref:Uncharacterized protein n=1 Tax=Demequina lignilytica TaxID=3051663 RepID=A0AB35MI93_9MICO|nr:hypothetical protein [Demequina sp. SYSU T0a273]MDN4483515.1 hypothetical protein [Demequina sp. SYSU T0a273]